MMSRRKDVNMSVHDLYQRDEVTYHDFYKDLE